MELIGDLLPPGVLNIVSGFGLEAGKPLASSKRIAKIAFTGETTTGRLIMQYASQNLIPITLELGGKSPNVFFADIMDKDDDFFDKCLEGFAMFTLNQGEVCTCPSRALVQESIYDKFMERAVARTKAVKQDNPLKMETMIGAQASVEQMEKIKSYLDLGKKEGAKVLCGGNVAKLNGGLEKGNYIEPTIFEGDNSMRVFQEEIFGPVVSVTKFKDEAHALEIANDTLYGLGAGVWTRNGNVAYRMGRRERAQPKPRMLRWRQRRPVFTADSACIHDLGQHHSLQHREPGGVSLEQDCHKQTGISATQHFSHMSSDSQPNQLVEASTSPRHFDGCHGCWAELPDGGSRTGWSSREQHAPQPHAP